MDERIMLTAVMIQGFVGLLIIVGAFWRLAKRDADRDSALAATRSLAERNAEDLKAHDIQCKESWNENRERLAEGSNKMTEMATHQDHMRADILEVKDDIKSLLHRVRNDA